MADSNSLDTPRYVRSPFRYSSSCGIMLDVGTWWLVGSGDFLPLTFPPGTQPQPEIILLGPVMVIPEPGCVCMVLYRSSAQWLKGSRWAISYPLWPPETMQNARQWSYRTRIKFRPADSIPKRVRLIASSWSNRHACTWRGVQCFPATFCFSRKAPINPNLRGDNKTIQDVNKEASLEAVGVIWITDTRVALRSRLETSQHETNWGRNRTVM